MPDGASLSLPLHSSNQQHPHQQHATIEVHRPAEDTASIRSGVSRSVLSRYSKASLTTFRRGELRDALSRRVHMVSLVVNVLLFGSKLWVYLSSGAMVVLAALVDSTVDLLAQAILLVTNRLATDQQGATKVLYPAGRSRAEPVGVIACALLMAMASAQVIRDALVSLYGYWQHGDVRPVDMTYYDLGLLASTIALKFVLYLWCRSKFAETNNVTVEAVAQDHLNDVLSNLGALAAAVLTQLSPSLWLADPVGAVAISVYIIHSWLCTGMEQLEFLVGRSADPEFLDQVREMAETHDPAASLDLVRAYHFGPRFLVEIEIVMLPETPLRVSHDVGIMLQHKIERLEQVDRCFVHVDYQVREIDDHDPNTPLSYKTVEAATLPPRPFLETASPLTAPPEHPSGTSLRAPPPVS